MTKSMLLFVCLSIAAAQDDPWGDLVGRGAAAEKAGQYAAAVDFYRQASTLAESFHPADARRVFGFNAQGTMYDALGRFADAELAYRRALAALDQAQVPAPINRAVILANLANIYYQMGHPARAEKMLRDAIAAHLAVPAPDPVKLAVARNGLAELLTVTGRHAEAEPLLQASLSVMENIPEASAEVGIAKNNLGAVRLYQGRFAEAQTMLEEALALLQKARGPSHPIVLRTLHNLAIAQERNGQIRAAGYTWRRAVDLAADTLGLEHPLYGEILGAYAAWLRASGDKSAGKIMAARSAEILRDHHRRNGIGGLVDVSALQGRSK